MSAGIIAPFLLIIYTVNSSSNAALDPLFLLAARRLLDVEGDSPVMASLSDWIDFSRSSAKRATDSLFCMRFSREVLDLSLFLVRFKLVSISPARSLSRRLSMMSSSSPDWFASSEHSLLVTIPSCISPHLLPSLVSTPRSFCALIRSLRSSSARLAFSIFSSFFLAETLSVIARSQLDVNVLKMPKNSSGFI